MTEEEKKAIEYLEDSFKNTVTHKEKLNIIKNLIKSQQKEIYEKEYLYKKALNDLVKAEKENKEKLQQIECLKQAGEATETVYKMQLERKIK